MKTIFSAGSMFCAFLLCLTLFTTLSAGNPLPVHPEKTLANEVKDSLWASFRREFPYHIQTIARSEPRADGSLVLIIAEPPPHVNQKEIEAIFAGLPISSLEERQHAVGYDGWTKDLIAVVSMGKNHDLLEHKLLRLHEYLFFTPYKADFHYLERPLPFSPDRDWNKEVSSIELRSWMGTEEQFIPAEGGEARPLKTILAGGMKGLWFSYKPGFVAWILPWASDIIGQRQDFRRFTIDADLILGAASYRGMVAIIGRERLSELHILPPLRTETMLMLAATLKQELGQSYERNSVFAGKFDGENDWAPIYLSDELKNGEFGSLLNITDQLLKSWSSNGTVRYHGFQDYPDPEKWCFDKPIMWELNAESLTFNWNIKGGSYSTEPEEEGVEYYALNRGGALPVSYIPDENNPSKEQSRTVVPYEEKAYQCFAQWKDPNLVRVVQYTALFQIFRKYDIYATVIPALAPTSKVLERAVRTGFDRIIALDSSGVYQLSMNLAKQQIRFAPGTSETFIQNSLARQAAANFPEIKRRADKTKQGITEVANRFGESGLIFIAGIIADRNYRSDFPRKQALIDLLNTFHGACFFLLSEMADKAAIKDSLSVSLQKSSGPWIKTPSLVISRAFTTQQPDANGKIITLTGGHNLGMNFTRFVLDPNIPPGEVRAEPGNYRNVMRINPADEARLSPKVLRTANRIVDAKDLAQLANEVRQELVNAPPRKVGKRNEIIPEPETYFRRGYCPQHERPREISFIRLLGYAGIRDYQTRHKLTATGTLTPEVSQKLAAEMEAVRADLNEIGFGRKTFEEEVNDYSAHVLGKPAAITPEVRLRITADKNTWQLIKNGKKLPANTAASEMRLDKGDGTPGKQFLMLEPEKEGDVWEIDGQKVLNRKKGAAGQAIIENALNERCAEWSTDQIKIARINGIRSQDKEVAITVDNTTFRFPKTDALNDLTRESNQNAAFALAFDRFLQTQFSPDKPITLLFTFDEWFGAGAANAGSGSAPVVSGLFPGADFINPHKLAAFLAQHFPPYRTPGRPAVQIGLCRPNLALAVKNASKPVNIRGMEDIGLVFQHDDFLTAENIILNDVQSTVMNLKGRVFELQDDVMLEVNNYILIVGRKTAEFRQKISEAAQKGLFKDKSIVLLTCYEPFDVNEVEFNSSVLLSGGGARGVYMYDTRIELNQMRHVLNSFYQRLSQLRAETNLYELLYRSIEEAAKTKTQILSFLKGIFQYSARPEHAGQDQTG